MRILQLAPQFPFPMTDGGKIGIANTFKYLASMGNEITFFCYSPKEVDKFHLDEARKYGEIHLCNHSTSNSAIRIAKSVFDKEPIYLRKHLNENIKQEIDKLFEENQFNIVHADHSAMAPLALYIKQKYKIPVGLRLHNVEYKIWQRYAENLPIISPKKYYVQHQANLLKSAETYLYENCDVCFSITEIDKLDAQAISPNANVINVNTGVDFENWKPINAKKSDFELIFASNFSWIHNVNAINWFIKNVMPELKLKFPKITLKILGSNQPENFKNFTDLGVISMGFVPEIQSHLSNANVYIAPLFVGSGVRIKILEAMAMALPVVASPISAEGISGSSDDGLFVANNKNEFIEHISALLNNSEKAMKLGKNARQFVINHHDWKKNISIIHENYQILTK